MYRSPRTAQAVTLRTGTSTSTRASATTSVETTPPVALASALLPVSRAPRSLLWVEAWAWVRAAAAATAAAAVAAAVEAAAPLSLQAAAAAAAGVLPLLLARVRRP
jgi:hypothetical protein